MKHNKVWIAVLVITLLLVGVMTVLAQTPSSPTSGGGIVPYIVDNPGPGGNVTCEQLGYEFSSGRIDYKDKDAPPGMPWKDEDDNYHASFPYPGITVAVTDDTYVDWASSFAIGAVIVKGSAAANIYEYDPQAYSDFGLASPPVGAQQKPAELSNLTFCWHPEEEECDWFGETAWADGSRYTTRGNWATYTSYDGSEKTVTLYAGQTLNAGTVHFSAPSGGVVTITITLNPGWRFEAVDENVKIQDYASAPSGNPAPGLFAHKATAAASPFSIDVPENHFYGVHVNAEQEVCH
jgi:hypothetical protein